MVDEIKQIIARYPKQTKSDLEVLVAYARENPEEEIVFLLLKNYTPDLFNSDLWNRADEISLKYKNQTQLNSRDFTEQSPEVKSSKNVSLEEQWRIIENFMKQSVPDFL
jgi:hypothetical protein